MRCYAAVRELNLHREIFHTAVPSIVLAGDSAGGNLSAAVSLLAAGRGEFSVEKQILIYPAVYYMRKYFAEFLVEKMQLSRAGMPIRERQTHFYTAGSGAESAH